MDFVNTQKNSVTFQKSCLLTELISVVCGENGNWDVNRGWSFVDVSSWLGISFFGDVTAPSFWEVMKSFFIVENIAVEVTLVVDVNTLELDGEIELLALSKDRLLIHNK